jgi:PKD repeat protein
LSAIYSAISGKIKGETQVKSATGTVDQGATTIQKVLADNTMSELTVTVNWVGSDIDTYLYYPNGSFADPAIYPDIEYSGNDTKPEWYRIANPQTGGWSVDIYGKDVPPTGEDYSFTASAMTTLTFQATTDKSIVDVNEPVKIIVSIMNGTDPVIGTNVIANITKPDDSVDTLILQDKNSGIYEAYYDNTDIEGGYTVKVTAVKIGEFTREGTTQFRAQDIEPSIIPSPNNWALDLPQGNKGNKTIMVSVSQDAQMSSTKEFQLIVEEVAGTEKATNILSLAASQSVVAVIQGTSLTDSAGHIIPENAWSFSPNILTIEPGSSDTFEAYLTIPIDTEPGAYDGTIVITTSVGNAKVDVTCVVVPILETVLPNVKVVSVDPTVTSINVTRLNLSAINETFKPAGVTSQFAYMINSTGAGNITLRFTNITDANTTTAYKINATNHWIPLNTSTTTDTVTFTMSVGDPPVVFGTLVSNQPPIVSFTFSPPEPFVKLFVNQTITFDASASYDPDGFITNYEWDFGDGNTTNTTKEVVTHLYTSAGNYTVNLTVTDDDGAMNATSKLIEVKETKPTVSISTNKKEYHPWDVMIITIHLENPTETTQQVLFKWDLILPDYDYWINITSTEFTLSPMSVEYFLMSLKVVNWPSVEFNATWYVAFYNTTTLEKISEDTADWKYEPHLKAKGERIPEAEEIAIEITKTVEANLPVINETFMIERQK